MIDTVRSRTRKYLEESEKWQEKWGNFLVMSEEIRPKEMPPRPNAPYELILWYQMEGHNALLVEGGILDQPYITWTCVQAVGLEISEYEYVQRKRMEINNRLQK